MEIEEIGNISMNTRFSNLLRQWESSDLDASRKAFLEIKSMKDGALPILSEALAPDSPKLGEACGLVLELDESEASELVLPLMKRDDLVTALLYRIADAKAALPWLWNSLTTALGSTERTVRLRTLDAVQAQITQAKIEELDLGEWARELKDPLVVSIGSGDYHAIANAAEAVMRLPLIDDEIAGALEVAIRGCLDRKEAGLKSLAEAWAIQKVNDGLKVEVLGWILRRGIYPHDRYVAARCAGRLGPVAKALAPECRMVLESISSGPSKKPSQIVKRLARSVERMEGAQVDCPTKPRAGSGDARLDRWMDAMEDRESHSSSSRHESGSIAREQIRRCRDAILVGPLLKALGRKPDATRYHNLLTVVDNLVKNTGSRELREWLKSECDKEDLKPKQIESLLYVKQPEVLPLARRAMFLKNGAYSSRCLDHLKLHPSEENVYLMSEAGRQFPSLRLLVIFALEQAGSRQAVPYLLELATKDIESKRGQEIEWKAYAILALGVIGDRSVVPNLCGMLGRGEGTAVIVQALAELGDRRGLSPAVEALRPRLPELKGSRQWSPGHRTLVYNVFHLAWKCDALVDPEVRTLAEDVIRPEIWSELLPEEMLFLREIGIAPETEESPAAG